MQTYEINSETIAIIPYNTNKTKIIEKDHTFFINKNSIKIMEESCEFFGSSLLGRQKGTTKLIGVTHKAPIIIEETKDIIFFPTTSPRLQNCSWISLNNLIDYKKINKKSILYFKNNINLEFNISYGIIDNQVLRATRLESVLRKRKIDKRL